VYWYNVAGRKFGLGNSVVYALVASSRRKILMRTNSFWLHLTGRIGILLAALCVLAVSPVSHAESRHALVIGNSEYRAGYGLATPFNDSTAIATKLSAMGYKIHGGGALLNLELDAFNDEIESFVNSVEDGSSTLIYYAGHGAASRGNNYLIPILPAGVRLRSDSDIRDRSISLQSVLERVEDRNPSGVNVFFFDACRDAPVETSTRSINLSGLTSLDTSRQPRGSFVGFSTEYGKLALDGDDPEGNSPFAKAVLSSLDTAASTPIELFYKGVTEEVYEDTLGQQFPIQESKLRGNHCIIECESVTSNVTSQEFGTLMVDAKPLDAEVCYRIDGWTSWNCGEQSVLPLDTPVMVRVTARGHKTYTSTTRLQQDRQVLSVRLDKNKSSTWKIVGGVAAAIVVGGVLLSGSDSGGGENNGEVYNINITPPQ